MTPPELETQVRNFFDAFVEAFRTFDGKTVAGRYLAPYLAFHHASSTDVFMTSEEIGSYFQRIVDGYHAQGCRSCRYTGLAVAPLGKNCAIGTVTWELLDGQGSVISGWRESYNLCRVDGRFRVFATTDHAA